MTRGNLLLTMLLLAPLELALGQHKILGIDVNEDSAVVRLDGKPQYRVFTLESPDRLVIDLKGAALKDKYLFSKAATGPVLRVRSAPRNRHDQRVVLDLRHRVDIRTREYSIPNGQHGVAIDFSGADEPRKTIPGRLEHRPAPVRVSKLQRCTRPAPAGAFVVAVDAGHGGRDTGAVGPNGTREKDVTLDIAYRLHGLLAATPGVHSVLVRDTDAFIRLRDRHLRAQACRADLLVSIHADAQHSAAVRGASVYVYPPRKGGNRFQRTSASFASLGNFRTTADLRFDTLPGLSTAHPSSVASHVAGYTILRELGREVRLLREKVLNGRFTVLSSAVPSVLVETGFISHDREESQLRDPAYQQRLARAVYSGINQYMVRYARPKRMPNSEIHMAGTL